MSDALEHDDEATIAIKRKQARRTRIIVCLIIAIGIALWQIVTTELRVADLQARGFGDVAISSARNHAYFPLIGGYLGALLAIGIVKAIRHACGATSD